MSHYSNNFVVPNAPQQFLAPLAVNNLKIRGEGGWLSQFPLEGGMKCKVPDEK